MNFSWQAFLGAQGANFKENLITDFAHAEAHTATQLGATQKNSAATLLMPLTQFGLLEFSGLDTQNFLQNQLTNDINLLVGQRAQYSAWCSAKGRMLASFVFYRARAESQLDALEKLATEPTIYRALLSRDLLAACQQGLQKYVLRSKVVIKDRSADVEVFGLSGKNAAKALENVQLPVPSQAMEWATNAQGTVISLDEQRFVLIIAEAQAQVLWKALSALAMPVGTPVWTWLDIQAGTATISQPTREAFVPQMLNFEKIGGVSFKKGCYPGQEIIARSQYLGKIKRHLYRVTASEPITDGTRIFSASSPDLFCGSIASSAPDPDHGTIALAVIQEDYVGKGDLCLEQGAQDTAVRIQLLARV